MSIQIINSWYQMGIPSFQEMRPTCKLTPLQQIQQRYQEIEANRRYLASQALPFHNKLHNLKE